MKPLINNATVRNTINTNNFQFQYNKLLTLRGIKIQNDVLTKETIKANVLRLVSALSRIMATCIMIYNYISPDSTVKTASLVAGAASNIINRTKTIFRYGYGEKEDEPSVSRLAVWQDKQVRGVPCFEDELERKDKLSRG